MAMANNERARPAQIELMLSYMERHGDIQNLTVKECLKRWKELTDLLNDNSFGEPKPVGIWKKCWSDFKNNTKKKEFRATRKAGRVDLSKLERRLLKLIEREKSARKIEVNALPERDSLYTFEIKAPPCRLIEFQYNPAGSRKSDDFLGVDTPSDEDVDVEGVDTGNSNEEPPTPGNSTFEDNIKAVADKYLEFEREREKLAHDREMARIKQNEQLIMIFGKVANVLEMLTPNIQKCLDLSTNVTG